MVSDELKKIYADAAEEGIYVKEFPAEEGFIAFAGKTKKLENAGFDKEKRKNMDHMMASIYMSMGGGDSREAAVNHAVKM